MSPRISTREAYSVKLPINPLTRYRVVAAHLIDITNETGLAFEWSGLIGRTELIRAAQMADDWEIAQRTGSEITGTTIRTQYGELKEE